jgi:hypothetical protein
MRLIFCIVILCADVLNVYYFSFKLSAYKSKTPHVMFLMLLEVCQLMMKTTIVTRVVKLITSERATFRAEVQVNDLFCTLHFVKDSSQKFCASARKSLSRCLCPCL